MSQELIALVSCVKSKKAKSCSAKDLYISPLFRMMRSYAEQHADRWFILSAKFGLVYPKQTIEPYEQTLTGVGVKICREWASRVYDQMQEEGLLHPGVSFLWLAGRAYKQFLSDKLSCFPQTDPLIGKKFGQRLAWLKAQTLSL
ncbi:MAG: DUF6884 domain-containing protein [Planctomycetota bacterium]|jgi:hypothetical protein